MNKPARLPRPAMAFCLAMAAASLSAAVSGAQAAWPPLPGDLPIEKSAESADIRARTWDSLLGAGREQALSYERRVESNAWGRWSVYVDRSESGAKGAFYTVFSPERNGGWPQYAQGSWIVKRSRADGSFIQAKVFLRSDAGTFARVYPFGSRSLIDIVAYGGVLYREVIIPMPFETILRSPFARVRELTADVIDWSLFSPQPALYGDALALIRAVRARLPGLRYADDGAIDADGVARRISDLLPQSAPAGLNCSGFAKWLVDGTLAPISGAYLSIDELRRRMTDYRGSSFTEKFEELYDPFFGLDWARSLAKAAWSALYPARLDDSPLAYDVNEPPFALIVANAEPVNGGSAYQVYSDNFDDAGFELRGLKAVLFTLAAREPGRYYLAQFSARDPKPPRLRRYFHLAALFPYFDADGVFRVTVFESAEETSLDRIMADRDYEFVKLVRMPIPGRFSPQTLAP